MGNNCVASTSIGCLLCCQRCNVEKIRSAALFVPPQSSYTVEAAPSRNGEERGKLIYVYDPLRNHSFYQQAASHAEIHFLTTVVGERIPIAWVRPGGSSSASPKAESRIVLLHCHGNATDLGIMMGPYFALSQQLGIEVVGVEYAGYGMATGVPSCPGLYHDIEAAFKYVVSQGVKPERIVAYGQSVGSGPALHIATKQKLGGVVLHSGFLSAISIIDPKPDSCCKPSCVFCSCDYYPNLKNIKKVKCPAFVIHGQSDDIVPFFHGEQLYRATPDVYKWPGYFPMSGHNDLVETNASTYFQQIDNFLRSIVGGFGISARPHEKAPIQIEMGEVTSIYGAREVDRQEPEKAFEGGDFTLSYPEPLVGPDDGRYGAMRRERRKSKEDGDTHTLQMAPLVSNTS